jgi:serine/threonine protein kinase
MPAETYHVRSRGQVTGPYTRSQLSARVATGHLTGVHMVSADGQQSWTLAKNLSWLFGDAQWGGPVAYADAPTAVTGHAQAGGQRRPPLPPPPPPGTAIPATAIPRTAIPATAIPATAIPATAIPQTAFAAAGAAGGGPPAGRPTSRAVFVSHSSADAAAATELVNYLEDAGIGCWIAPRDIPPGTDYSDQIMNGIEECPVMLLVFSRHVINSDPAKREIERGRNRNSTVLPVRLDQTPLTGGLEYLIAMSQWIDAYPPPLGRHLANVAAAVRVALGLARTAPGPGGRAAKGQQPQYVGPYRLIEPIGEGGMGSVYKAEQLVPVKRIVAVKVIKLGLDSADVIARFESERQALARMTHPNIARVLDAGTDENGRPYFVMEYVPGMPITKFADVQKLSVRDRLELFVEVCDAIAHAHSKSILHRDIKPGNVLAYVADQRPTVKVIDFGIAKAMTGEKLTDRTLDTSVGKTIGTLACMSPEQAEGSPDVDTRSDVYSLGVLLYELLTGAKPFDPDALNRVSDLEARRLICEAEPPPPGTRLTDLGEAATAVAAARQSRVDALAKDLAGELGWIPLMAMRKERQRRYASPLLMAEDVRNYLAGRPLMAGPESRAYKFRKFAGRNRAALAAAAVVLLTVVGGVTTYVLWITNLRDRATKQEQIARSVNRLLYDVLSAADPKQSTGTNLVDSMNQAVAGLAARDGSDGAQPEVQALILDTVGNVQRSLGKLDEAEQKLTKALKLRRASLPPGDPDIGRTLDHLGHLLKNRYEDEKGQGKGADPEKVARHFAGALTMYDEAIEVFRKTLPADDLDVADTLANRASLLESAGERLGEAEANSREALRVRRAKSAPVSDVLQSLGNLADVLRKQTPPRYAEAERLIREALGLAAVLEPNDPSRARLLLQHAKLLKELGNLAEAEAACREALRIDLAVFPEDHKYVTKALEKLNEVLAAARKPAEKLAPVRPARAGKRG